VKSLWCRMFGHKWKVAWENPYADTFAYAQCAWCKEPGWAVPVK
jgi:hypothetical protein